MRVSLMFLGASGAVSGTVSNCDESDGNSLLQARTVIRKHVHVAEQEGADVLLQSMKKVAKSLQKDSTVTMTSDDVNTAIGAAGSALATMVPLFAQQTTLAQQEVGIQFAEIGACHSSAIHGAETTNSHEESVATNRAARDQCHVALAQAIETQTRDCDEYNNYASGLFNDLPGCSTPSTPQDLLSTTREMAQFVSNVHSDLESKNTACNEATTAAAAQTDLCTALTDVYEESFCRYSLSCHRFAECHAHEVEVYNALQVDIEAAVVARQQQYITVMQSQCILDLITTALQTSTPIDHASLTRCDDVSVDELAITFPDPPEAPEDCPSPHGDDPQCGAQAVWAFVGATVDGCVGSDAHSGEHPLTFHRDAGHIAAARCCSMDGSTCRSAGLEGGEDVHHNGRLHSEDCISDKTFLEAHGLCAANGLRLCNTDEVQACCGTGCRHDHNAIWVRVVGSTVDGCAGRDDTHEEHPLTAHEDETHTADVRCCSMDGSSCQSENLHGGVDFATYEGCIFDKTFAEAHEICAASGLRLCAQDEVQTCCNTGCQHNRHAIWVSPNGH